MDDGGREGALAPRDLLFAQTLLSEIGGAARRTARVFAGALQDLYGMVTRSLLSDAQSRAALAMQILDRNLYERANDCRWWALTPQFASTLRTGETGCARASAVLRDINALYTVYSGLALFDRQGRVVAVSRAEHEPHVGAALGDHVRLGQGLVQGFPQGTVTKVERRLARLLDLSLGILLVRGPLAVELLHLLDQGFELFLARIAQVLHRAAHPFFE